MARVKSVRSDSRVHLAQQYKAYTTSREPDRGVATTSEVGNSYFQSQDADRGTRKAHR